jgi:hypothetical protein
MSNSTIPQAADCKHVPTGPWACSAEAYDRIIAAVGEKPADSDQLVSDLLNARSKLLLFVVLDSDKGAKARKKLFSGIADDAIALKDKLLANQEYAARVLFPEVPRRRHTLLGELDHIIDGAKISEKQNSGAWARLERPLHELFAAEILTDVFKRNFPAVHERHPGKPVGFSRPPRGGQPGGPYIKFAVAVMCEMGMSIKPTTLARALQDVRKGRVGRKKERSTTVTASRRPSGW